MPTSVGNFFKNLVKIQVLEVPLATISSNDFVNINSLQIIEIRKTFLSLLPEDTFVNLLTLEILNLSDNRIQDLKPKTFGNLRNLRRVLLSGNLLISLPSQLFVMNMNLEEIDLSANRLRFIDNSTFNSLKNSTSILMADNFCITENLSFQIMMNEISENCKSVSVVVNKFNLTETWSENFKLKEMNEDLRFEVQRAFSNIEFLKTSYDNLKANYTIIDEFYLKKFAQETSLRNQSEIMLSEVEVSRAIMTKSLFISSTVFFVLLIIIIITFTVKINRLKSKLKKLQNSNEMTYSTNEFIKSLY
jgi:Leucine-rich repeat (LRR) protein